MFKRLLITAASTAALGLVPVSCGDSGAGSDKPLRWRTAVDVPVNFTMKVGKGLNTAELLPEADCDELSEREGFRDAFLIKPCEDWTVRELMDLAASLPDNPGNPKPELLSDTSHVFDLGSDSISTESDVINVLRKLTDTKIQYSITAANKTNISLTFFGMLFPITDTAAMRDSVGVFYKSIIENNSADIANGRVNMFGKTGLFLEADSVGSYPLKPKGLSDSSDGKRLGDLVIGKKAFAYRWIVKLEDIKNLKDTSETKETVDIKLRIRFSGVNSVDSLFTL